MELHDPKTLDLDKTYAQIQDASHRRPYKAGAADRYYGRNRRPNFSYMNTTFYEDAMSPEQVAEYHKGWDEQFEVKDWR